MMRPGSGYAVLACALQLTLVLAVTDVRKPPEIVDPAKAETRYLFENKKAVIKCQATGIPTPTYLWSKNDAIVDVNNFVSFDSTNGDLIFESFTRREEGEYICIATNVFDDSPGPHRMKASSMSPPLQLLAVRVDAFDDSIPTSVQKVTEYSYLKVQCRGKGTIQVARPTFNWYDGEKSKQLSNEDGRLFIDNDGSLHFVYVLAKDGDIETYRCGASNAKTNIVLGSPSKVEVTPTGSGPNTAIKPTFQYSNNGKKFMLYSDATLECVFSGYDPQGPHIPKITWFDDASNIIEPGPTDLKYELSQDRNKLTIKNVQETDEKNFYCQAENRAGVSNKERILLDVVSAPIFYQEKGAPKDMTKPENKDATFYCRARSLSNEPPPEAPVWYINSAMIGTHTDTNKHVLSPDMKSLTIKRLSKLTDIQCVQCSVRNNYGSARGDGCLNVILPISITKQPPVKQEIEKGDTVDLTILATTDPSETLSYSWEFNNVSFAVKPPHVTYDPQSLVAYINTSQLSQDEYDSVGGVYRRIITNANDQKILDIEVVLKDTTVPVAVVSDGGIDMWIIGLIIGIIFLIIVIIIIIFVICRKKQEGDYNVDKKETGAGLDPEKELKEKGFDDYSRPTYDDYEYPEKKPRGELEYDDVPIGGDDESLAEYGDEADMHFNEDGSFIGVYQNNRNKGQPKSTESTI